MNIKDCDTETITKKSLDNFNIPYDSLNLHISDKLTFCKEHEIDVLIEDSYETCRELADNGIKSILMTTKMNSDIEDKEIVRVNNWDEIYEEIEKYKKIENCNPNNVPKGYYISVVGVVIINDNNEILLQKRSRLKRANPSKWGICGGKVDLGEAPIDVGVCETLEEIGAFFG